MRELKTAFITFFPINPNNMGSAAVVNSRFKSWPKNKKIFQISHIKKIHNRYIYTIFIKKESPINKIIKLPQLIYEVIQYVNTAKKKLIIIEGASWIFYSFVTIIFLKLFLPNCKIIYVSHSIESEIRRKYSNTFIYLLTKFLERLVFKSADLSTSVSKRERNKIFKIYKKKTIYYPNAIDLDNKHLKRKKTFDYIIYSGSYFYKPNKDAIDFLIEKIMPNVLKKFPQLKLVLTGGGINKKFPWLINKGIVSKKILYNLIFNAKCMCVPLKFGSGTRIKIIEALTLGTVVISTQKGIEGINLCRQKPPFIVDKKNEIVSTIINILKNSYNLRKISLRDRVFYKKNYSMNNITKNFINLNLNKYLDESCNK